jgi:hypothetical protein
VPVIVDCALRDFTSDEVGRELCAGAKGLGGSAVGLRYYNGDYADGSELEEALRGAVAAAAESGLEVVLLGEFGANGDEGCEGAGSLAQSLGAAAGLAKDPVPIKKGEALSLGCWNGTPDDLQRLRDAGFMGGLVLKNACNGNVGLGANLKSPSPAAQLVTRRVKAALSKGNKAVWGGAGSVKQGDSSGGATDWESYFDRG